MGSINRLFSIMALTSLLSILLFYVLAGATIKNIGAQRSIDLTGTWKADDGGKYYVRQIDNTVWWLGMSTGGGLVYTNVFKGTINNNIVAGNWTGVPLGASLLQNSLTLNVSSDGTLMNKIKGNFFPAVLQKDTTGPSLPLSPPSPNATAPPPSPPTFNYIITVDTFHIYATRSLDKDHVQAHLEVQVGNQPAAVNNHDWGDRDDGFTHPGPGEGPTAKVGPVLVRGDGPNVRIHYDLQNCCSILPSAATCDGTVADKTVILTPTQLDEMTNNPAGIYSEGDEHGYPPADGWCNLTHDGSHYLVTWSLTKRPA